MKTDLEVADLVQRGPSCPKQEDAEALGKGSQVTMATQSPRHPRLLEHPSPIARPYVVSICPKHQPEEGLAVPFSAR